MGRVDKKKKSKPQRVSPLIALILRIGAFCLAFVLLMGFSYLPGVRKNLDFSVRKRVAKVLTLAYPDYQIATVSAKPSSEKDNLLTIGYLQKKEIEAIAAQQSNGAAYLNMKFNQVQLRIRELLVTPILILLLLFLFTPIRLRYKLLSMAIGLAIVYGLILFKIIAILGYSITNTYAPGNISSIQRMIPYFSSPGLVFLMVIIIWMALVLPFLDRKKIENYFTL
jgi:hypothetical protein